MFYPSSPSPLFCPLLFKVILNNVKFNGEYKTSVNDGVYAHSPTRLHASPSWWCFFFFFYLLCFFLSLFRELMDHSGPPKSIQCSEDRRPWPGQPTSFLRERDSCRILLMGVMRSQPTWECTTCCIEHGHVGQLGFRVFCCRCRCCCRWCYCSANLNPGERTLALSHICHEVVLSHQDH